MEKESEKILSDFRERLASYIGLRFELWKLNTCERAAKISAALAHSAILLALGLFAILFAFFAIGFFFGELTGSFSVGFLIVFFIYLLLMLIVRYRKKSIRLAIANLIVGFVLDEEAEANEEKTNHPAHEEE